MKNVLLLTILSLTLFACNSVDVKKLQADVQKSFETESGYKAKEVNLIKVEKNYYRGFVTLLDGTKAAIDVTVDLSNGSFIWEITQPSETMIQDQMKKAEEEYDKQLEKDFAAIDSTFDSLYAD